MQTSQRLGIPAGPIWKNGAMVAGFSSLLKCDPGIKKGVVVLANDLNVSATLMLAEIALGTQPAFLPDLLIPSTLINKYCGNYLSLDGKQEIDVFPVGSKYLGIKKSKGFPKEAPESLYFWRLQAQSHSVFLVNDGVGISDAVIFKIDEAAPEIQLVYARFEGIGSNDKRVYHRDFYQKQITQQLSDGVKH